MKLNLTAVFTLMLLILMLGAGCVSGMWTFKLGHQALKDVTQPDVRTNRLRGRKGTSLQPGEVAILKEEDILTNVKTWIESKGKHPKPEKPQNEKKSSKQIPVQKTQSAAGEISQPGFPITSRNQGVTLEVLSARYSGGSLLLKLNFKNEGAKAVQFLYSFLDVTDDQGRTLSANTQGLPEDLPANGQIFSGTLSIPMVLLDNVKKVSLTLTDYPEQQLRLQVPNIPLIK